MAMDYKNAGVDIDARNNYDEVMIIFVIGAG